MAWFPRKPRNELSVTYFNFGCVFCYVYLFEHWMWNFAGFPGLHIILIIFRGFFIFSWNDSFHYSVLSVLRNIAPCFCRYCVFLVVLWRLLHGRVPCSANPECNLIGAVRAVSSIFMTTYRQNKFPLCLGLFCSFVREDSFHVGQGSSRDELSDTNDACVPSRPESEGKK